MPLPLRLGFIELPVVGEVPGVAELAAARCRSARALGFAPGAVASGGRVVSVSLLFAVECLTELSLRIV